MQVEINEKYISRQISINIRGQMENKLIPLFIKNLILKSLYTKMGETKYSTSISNMGIIQFDKAIEDLIKSVEFIPPPSALCKIKLGIVTHGNKTSICFGSTVKETILEQLFFSRLVKDGIKISIESNRS